MWSTQPARRSWRRRLGAKALSIHGQAGGGTAVYEQTRRDQPALSDEEILALARLGQRVAEEYGFPQDIEWALAGGALYLLQSRADHFAVPAPGRLPPNRLLVFFSFAAVQGMLDPITPIGRSALASIFARGAALFGIHVTAETQTVSVPGRRALLDQFDQHYSQPARPAGWCRPSCPWWSRLRPRPCRLIFADPRLNPDQRRLRPGTVLKLARFFLPLAGNVFCNIASPHKRRVQIVGQAELLLVQLRDQLAAIHGDAARAPGADRRAF